MLRDMNLRSALLVGAATMLPVSQPAVAASDTASFVAPESPVVLTRELRRSLVDGKEVVSRRRYELRFVREGNGWRVDGTLVGSEVDAPPELAPLAEIEKQRPDNGLFPLRLDERGMIVAQQGAQDLAHASTARQAFDNAVERVGFAPSTRVAVGDMAGRIVAVGRAIGGNWPTDLFHPLAVSDSQVREMALPGGKIGRIVVAVDTRRNDRGMLAQFRRMVTTELDGTSRASMETWTVDP